MTAHDVQARKDKMGPAVRLLAIANCRLEGRHELSATAIQLLRLPTLTGGAYPPDHYCQRCFMIFDATGREVL